MGNSDIGGGSNWPVAVAMMTAQPRWNSSTVSGT
jgi:hypothetical protein